MIRNLLLGALAAVVVVGGYIGSVYWRASTDPYADVWANQKAYIAEQVANDTKWNAREAQDTYGGATPEETWAMYIDALKKGDVELAAKYHWVDQQEQSLENLTHAKRNNFLSKLLLIGTLKMNSTCSSGRDFCELVTISEDDKINDIHFFFRLNKQTNVWKIYDETKTYN